MALSPSWLAGRSDNCRAARSRRRESLERMKLYPTLRYTNAKAAHQWLQDAFGFEPHALYEDDNGNVAHAQMRWGSDMIMFGTAREDPTATASVKVGFTPPVRTPTPCASAREPARRSPRSPPTKTTAHATSPPAIWRATSGTSGPTSPVTTQGPLTQRRGHGASH